VFFKVRMHCMHNSFKSVKRGNFFGEAQNGIHTHALFGSTMVKRRSGCSFHIPGCRNRERTEQRHVYLSPPRCKARRNRTKTDMNAIPGQCSRPALIRASHRPPAPNLLNSTSRRNHMCSKAPAEVRLWVRSEAP
jgi:hypothetical protein